VVCDCESYDQGLACLLYGGFNITVYYRRFISLPLSAISDVNNR